MRTTAPSFAPLLILSLCVSVAACKQRDPAECSPFGDKPATLYSTPIPQCQEGSRLGPWSDRDGTARYACLYEPPGVSPTKQLPLVVFLHPSLIAADVAIERWTNVLDYLVSADLSGDPARRGFIVLAPQGRDTHHYYARPDASGLGWDNWYRQMNPADVTIEAHTYPENVDAAAIDHFIAEQVATGKVDRERIFLTGWSNGGAMAYLYALNRASIAAAAIYSAPDPYELALDVCPQSPVTHPPANAKEIPITNGHLPTYQLHNNCDIEGICPNISFFVGQLRGLGLDATNTIIDRAQNQVPRCDEKCGTDKDGDLLNLSAASRGTLNHLRWPDKWTAKMFDFLHDHPLKKTP